MGVNSLAVLGGLRLKENKEDWDVEREQQEKPRQSAEERRREWTDMALILCSQLNEARRKRGIVQSDWQAQVKGQGR